MDDGTEMMHFMLDGSNFEKQIDLFSPNFVLMRQKQFYYHFVFFLFL